MKKTLNKIASTFLIVSISTTFAFAQKYSGYKTPEQQHKIETLAKKDLLPEPLDQGVSKNISNTITVENTKAYEGFRGIKKSNKRDNLPNDHTGDAIRIISDLDNMSFSERQSGLEKLEQIMVKMSYGELKSIYLYTGSAIVEQALSTAWFGMDRSGTFSFPRQTTSESEPNNTASTANALSDTITGYLTAYDEDWYSITVSGAGDLKLETHATDATNGNVGDTKLYLYAADNTTNYVAFDDDGGSGSYSKIARRIEGTAPTPTDLFFSEYSEGSSNNKYLEIYNGTGAAVDLSNYLIMQNGNGGPWDEYVDQLSGTLEDGDVYVIANGSSDASILAETDITNTGICYFNGDDARALIKVVGTDTTILDYIGTFPDDPGSGWDVAGTSNATKDHTLVRKTSVVSGNTSWASSAGTDSEDSEWIVYEKDTWTDVGTHTVPNLNQYYVKVTGFSGTVAGSYALTYDNTPFNANNGIVVINEINYNPVIANDSTEFIELYNSGASAVDISGWNLLGIISSGGYSSQVPSDYILPSGASIAAGGYYVIARDSASFVSEYGSEADVYWGYSAYVYSGYPDYNYTYYDLNDAGESIEIKDSTGALVDEVTYDDYYPWPSEADGDNADGDGPTLELKDAALQNNLASSWKVSGVDGGTPGAANSMKSDIMLTSTSIISYQATGSTQDGTIEVKNMGYGDLTIDNIVSGQYVPATIYLSEGFESWPPEDWTLASFSSFGSSSSYYNWAQDSGNDYGPGTVTEGNSAAFFNVYDYSSGSMGLMTTPAIDLTSATSPSLTFDYWNSSGSDPVVTSVSTDGTTFTDVDTLTSGATSWWGRSIDLSAYNGQATVYVRLTCTSDYGVSNPHIDNMVIGEPGSTVVPDWLTVTAPTAIAPGDSGDLSFSFSSAAITSDYDGFATVNIHNNDPRDTLKTITASISVRGDTAVMSLSNISFNVGLFAVGDTSGSMSTTVNNLGGDTLVLDSATFAGGATSAYFTDLVSGTAVVPVIGSSSFTTKATSTVAGAHRDTLTVHANTDSSNNVKINYESYFVDVGTTDTLYSFDGEDGAVGWSLNNGAYTTGHNANGYINAIDGYIISPRSLTSPGDDVILSLANWDDETIEIQVYHSTDKTATAWTGWTALDTLELAASATAGAISRSVHSITLPTAADTGYIGIQFVAPTTVAYYTRLYDVVMAKSTPEEDTGEGGGDPYTTESFEEDWPPEGWTLQTNSGAGFLRSSSRSNTGSYSALYDDHSGAQDGWLITPAMDLTGYTNPTISYYEYQYYATYYTFHEVAVSTDMVNWTQLTTGVGVSYTWTEKTLDLSPYVGQTVYVGWHYTGNYSDEWNIDDVSMPYAPAPPAPEPELAVSGTGSINFNAVAYDSLSTDPAGSRTASVTVTNTGTDTLFAEMDLRWGGSFSVSVDTLVLLPDSSSDVVLTYEPAGPGPAHDTLDIVSNGGNASVVMKGHSYVADFVHDFENNTNLESLGYMTYNMSGGIYWSETTGTNSEPVGGNNLLRVGSHKYGGNTLLILPMITVDADGERLAFDAKVSTASPTISSTLHVLHLTSNSYGSWNTADTLGKYIIGDSDPTENSDFDTDWGLHFSDYYGITQGSGYIGLLVEDNSTTYAGAATLYIDNIRFVDAPTVPIVTMHPLEQSISYLSDPFSFSSKVVGQNTGGDTLFISGVISTDPNMVVSTVSDTVLKGDNIILNYSVASSYLVMGRYEEEITISHNDTLFSPGYSEYMIKTDFTHEMISFEGGSWPSELVTMDHDGDSITWQVGYNDDMHGSYAAYSMKEPSTPIAENMFATNLRYIQAGDKFIFDAEYTSANDPDFMHVVVSDDFGNDWNTIDTVGSPSGHYEYGLDDYVGKNIMLGIMDVNYGNSENDRLYVDRLLLPAATAIMPIASTRAMTANDSSYTHIGDTVLVSGVVTVSEEYGSVVVFQDSAAGLAAYDSGLRTEVSAGDRIVIRGELKNFRSLLQLSPVLDYMVVESDVDVQPLKVGVGDIVDGTGAEALESMLIRVENVTIVDTSDWGGTGSGFNVDIEGGGDTALVRVDRDTDLFATPLPYGALNITGVIQQYDYNSDPYDGFQLMPRQEDDIELMARYSGTITDVSTGTAVAGVSVETDIDSTGSDENGNYMVNASLDAERIDFNKQDYTDAFFAIDASEAGFNTIDVALDPSAPTALYENGFETVTDSGEVDSETAVGTQWAIVDTFFLSDTTVLPYQGNKFLAVMDSNGYAHNSYSWWTAPRQVDLSAYTNATIRMHAWSDAESCCDEVSVMIKSASDTTGDWTVVGEVTGYNSDDGWQEHSFDINYLDLALSTDMEVSLVFDSDGSVNGEGVAVDQIWVDGRNVFVALPPVNLMATNFEDSQVSLSWGVPGSDTAMVPMQVVNPSEFIDAQAIVNDIVENNSSMSGLTVSQWLANIRATNPKFNLHPQPRDVLMPYITNTPASRALTHYNVFREDDDGDWPLFDSAPSTEYIDQDVVNYEGYRYTVSAVYDEGESFETPSVIGTPGMVIPEDLPMMEDFNVPMGSLPGGWDIDTYQNNEGNEWNVDISENTFELYSFEVPEHGIFTYVSGNNDESKLTVSTLLTPHFSLTDPLPAVYLSFDSYASGSSYNNYDIVVRYGYGPWEVVEPVSASNEWSERTVDITDEVVGHPMVQIGFRYNEGYYWANGGWAIDNVKIGIEPGPNNLIALPGGTGEIHLHWGMDLSPEQDPGGNPSGVDENDRPVYLNAPQCEDCETVNTRIPGVLFGANFSSDEPTQFVEYDAQLDSIIELGNGTPTNWQTTYTDANGSGSFDDGDPGWIQFDWSPTQLNYDQWIISDAFDASGDSMFLMFDEYLDDYPGDGDTMTVHISTDGGATWTTVWETADADTSLPAGPSGFWNRHVYAMGAGTAQTKVAFSSRGLTSFNIDYWHIDNVYVYDEMPEDHYDVFNVFRDGEMIAESVEETMFIDSDVAFGDIYCYQIQPVHVSFPEGNTTLQGLSNTACSSPCNVPPPPAMLSTPADSAMIVLVQDADGNIVDTEGNSSLEFGWAQPDDHDGHELANAFMLQDQLQSLTAMLEIPHGVTSAGIPYADLVAVMTAAGQDEISGSWGIWTADSIDNSCCWAQAMSNMNQLTVNISQALKVDNEFIPDVFALHQNYPNPFNPVTNIVYDIPEASEVKITIYNITGQNVRTLAQGQHEPGRYRVQWNATNDYGNPLSSGMYIYRIHAGDFVSVKKLILMK